MKLEEITGVTYVDDDGTTYRRTIVDGEICDIPIEEQ